MAGSPSQQEKALATLKSLAASRDERVSADARWSLENPPSKETLARWLAPNPG